MLEINNLSIQLLNGKEIVDSLSFSLNSGDKLALIGEEGNGKSTIMKAIYDAHIVESFASVKGTINKNNEKIGYLEQILSYDDLNKRVVDFLLDGIDNDHDLLLKECYFYFSKFFMRKSIIDDNNYLNVLSGGELIKLQLIRILINNPTVLLFDEPTNDLDLDTLRFLEDFILDDNRPILFISHDEWMLDRCANRILHLEQIKHKQESRWTLANVDYETYIRQRRESFSIQTTKAIYEREKRKEKMDKLSQIRNKVEYRQNQCVRDPTQGRLLKKRMHVILSQERKMAKQEVPDFPIEEDQIKLFFNDIAKIPNNKKIMELHLDELRCANILLSKDIELNVYGSQKIVIIGKNGAGKTTLLKEINKYLQANSNLKIAYFSQDYANTIPLDVSPIAFLQSILGYDKETLTQIRTYLGALNFRAEETERAMSTFSGGQRAKVCILYLVLSNPQILILDEPSRNLSPLSLPIIREMLIEFPGAIIAVSHDRKLISSVFNYIYRLDAEGLHSIELEQV